MKRNKRIFSALVSMAMLSTSSPMAIFAYATETYVTTPASPGISFIVTDNALEGSVDKDVFNVLVPTSAAVESILKFTMDPEGLISQTDGAKYSTGGINVAEGDTLLFTNADTTDENGGTIKNYSCTSDTLKIFNQSSYDIDVQVDVSVDAASLNSVANNGSSVSLTTDPTFAADTNASLYLAITDPKTENILKAKDKDGNRNITVPYVPFDTKAVSSTSSATVKATVKGNPDNYEYKYDNTNGYSYGIKTTTSDSDLAFETFEFALTGSTNSAGDWSKLTDVSPKVTVVWNFSKAAVVAVPYVSKTSISSPDETITTAYDKSVTAVNLIKADGSKTEIGNNTSYCQISGTTLKITSTVFNLGTGIEITFNDGNSATVMFTKS